MDRQTEHEYREALDSLRFSSEGKERIMNNLMEQQEPTPAKRHSIRPLRTALIAAALCLALAGSAFAVAELNHIQVREEPSIFTNMDQYTMECAVDFYPLDTFNQELFALADPALHHEYFNTWDELEEFIGLDLVNNPVLDRADPVSNGGLWCVDDPQAECYQRHTEQERTHIFLLPFFIDDEELWIIQTNGTYLLDGVLINMYADIYTEQAEGKLYYTRGGGIVDPDKDHSLPIHGDGYHAETFFEYLKDCETSAETYTTPNGLTATIIKETFPDQHMKCSATFLIDGALFTVTAWEISPNDDAMEVLKTVLDGFAV